MNVYILMNVDTPVGITTDAKAADAHFIAGNGNWLNVLPCPDHIILDVVRDRPPTERDGDRYGLVLAFIDTGYIYMHHNSYVRDSWGTQYTAWAKLPEGGV